MWLALFNVCPLYCDYRPDFSAAWMNLGIVQNSLKRFEEAEKSYLTAIKYRKKYPDCYYNLGRLVSVLVFRKIASVIFRHVF